MATETQYDMPELDVLVRPGEVSQPVAEKPVVTKKNDRTVGGWFRRVFRGGEEPVTLRDKLRMDRAKDQFAQDFSDAIRPEDDEETGGANVQPEPAATIAGAGAESIVAAPAESVLVQTPAVEPGESGYAPGSMLRRLNKTPDARPYIPPTDVSTPTLANETDEPDFLKGLAPEPQPVKNVHPLNMPEPARAAEKVRTPAFFPEDVAEMKSGMRAAEVKRQEAALNAVARERTMAERIKNAEAKRAAGKTQLETTVKRVVDKTGDLVGAAYSVPDRAIAFAQRETGRVVDTVKQIDINIADWRNRAADELEASLNMYSAAIEDVALRTEAGIVKKLAEGARTTANVLNVAASVRLELARKQLVAQSKEYAELTGAWEKGTVSEDILDEQVKKMDATRKKIAELGKSGLASATESVATSLVVESAKTRTEAKKRKENGGKWLAGLRKWLVGAVDAKPNLA